MPMPIDAVLFELHVAVCFEAMYQAFARYTSLRGIETDSREKFMEWTRIMADHVGSIPEALIGVSLRENFQV
jgi:hypothetical protein